MTLPVRLGMIVIASAALGFFGIVFATDGLSAEWSRFRTELLSDFPDAAKGSANILIDVGRTGDVFKRLTVENVESQYAVAREISEAKGRSLAKVLRDLITQTSTDNFVSSLNIAAQPLVVRSENIETLAGFHTNVQRSFTSEAALSGLLRVWHGAPVVKPDPYPETVMVIGGGGLCSGILVTPNLVITAAHCFCDNINSEVSVGTSLLDVSDRSKVDVANSKSHIPCDQLKTASNIRKGDMAVYSLTTPLSSVPVRHIASEQTLRAAASVRAVGFGKTIQGPPGVKFAVDVVIASYDCTEGGATGLGCAPNSEFIAAGMNRDTCEGDSGGPVYVLGGDVSLYVAGLKVRGCDAGMREWRNLCQADHC